MNIRNNMEFLFGKVVDEYSNQIFGIYSIFVKLSLC